jgi:hypothetical protein
MSIQAPRELMYEAARSSWKDVVELARAARKGGCELGRSGASRKLLRLGGDTVDGRSQQRADVSTPRLDVLLKCLVVSVVEQARSSCARRLDRALFRQVLIIPDR